MNYAFMNKTTRDSFVGDGKAFFTMGTCMFKDGMIRVDEVVLPVGNWREVVILRHLANGVVAEMEIVSQKEHAPGKGSWHRRGVGDYG